MAPEKEKQEGVDLQVYKAICKNRFDKLEDHFGEVLEEIRGLRKTMFIGNGQEAWSTTIINVRKRWKWMSLAMGGILVAVLGRFIFDFITHIYGK